MDETTPPKWSGPIDSLPPYPLLWAPSSANIISSCVGMGYLLTFDTTLTNPTHCQMPLCITGTYQYHTLLTILITISHRGAPGNYSQCHNRLGNILWLCYTESAVWQRHWQPHPHQYGLLSEMSGLLSMAHSGTRPIRIPGPHTIPATIFWPNHIGDVCFRWCTNVKLHFGRIPLWCGAYILQNGGQQNLPGKPGHGRFLAWALALHLFFILQPSPTV